MCDQLRHDAVTDGFVKTPNIDSLRVDGVSFTQCYSQTPVCTPARHSLISGLDAFSVGLCENSLNRKPIKNPLPALVRDCGYYTCALRAMPM